jgi:hypothetical protein
MRIRLLWHRLKHKHNINSNSNNRLLKDGDLRRWT